MKDDDELCPSERNALKSFFDQSKGGEWTDSSTILIENEVKWLDEYESHCNWLGITCNSESHVIRLDLPNNGLSGRLSESLGDLKSLQAIDLSDNDIKARELYTRTLGIPFSLTDIPLLFV